MVSVGSLSDWLLRDSGVPGGDTVQPFGTGCAAELRAVAAREVRGRLEAAGRGYVYYGHRGLQQQLARAPQAHLQVVAVGYTIQVALEQPLDLAARQFRGRRDLIERQRPLDVVLHQLRDPDERLVARADLGPQRHVLPVAVVAHAVENELLGDQLRHLLAEAGLDEIQHQIEWGSAAGARKTVAVDAEQLVVQQNARKLFPQCRQVLPMDTGLVLVQQTCFGQRVTSGTQSAQWHPSLGEPAQRGQNLRRDGGLHIYTTTHEQDVDCADGVEGNRG